MRADGKRNQLGLTPASTSYTDAGREVEVVFEDWTIDGTPLRSLLGWARPPQEMTPLSSAGFWPRVAAQNLHELLGEVPSEFEDGRVPLLRCPIDADLGCAALSTQLVLLDDAVIWENIGWQNNYEPYVQDDDEPPLRFTFDRDAYDSLLRHTLARYVS